MTEHAIESVARVERIDRSNWCLSGYTDAHPQTTWRPCGRPRPRLRTRTRGDGQKRVKEEALAAAVATVRAGLLAAVGDAAASFGLIVLLGYLPRLVARITAPHHSDGFALDGVFGTDGADGAAELAPVGQAES